MVPEKSCRPGSSECHCSFRLLASLISKVHSCCIYPPENQYTVPLTNMLSAEEIGHSFQKYQVAFCFLLQFLSYQENPDPSALFSPKTTQYMTVFRDVRGVQSDQCLRGASSLLSSCWPSCRMDQKKQKEREEKGYVPVLDKCQFLAWKLNPQRKL